MKKMKSRWTWAALLTLLACIIMACAGTPQAAAPESGEIIATTLYGRVRGAADPDYDALIFRGIPYGKAERFMPPTAPDAWTNVFDATKNGPIAAQGAPIAGQSGGSINGDAVLGDYFSGGNKAKFAAAEETRSENCLVLNVVTPALDDAKRPVLVYMHGGGFVQGSGTITIGSGRMVEEQDIVVVGMNHRINAFGFTYLGAFDPMYQSSGMVGLLDLVQALKWVRDNIAEFGGNPYNVTIMGESGGGQKVSHLLGMPEAVKLFQRAYIQSGSQRAGFSSLEAATTSARTFLTNLGIDPAALRPGELRQRLAGFSTAEILAAGGGTAPMADGINLQPYTSNDFYSPEVSKHIPLIIGASEDERAVFSNMTEIERTATWDEVRSALRARGASAATIERVLANYPNHTPAHVKIIVDSVDTGTGSNLAYQQTMARARDSGAAPVFHYLNTFDSPLPGHSPYKYSWHTFELPLQFRLVQYPECEQLSVYWSNAIAAFMRTGDPSTASLSWPAFTASGQQVMVFGAGVPTVQMDPFRIIRDPASFR